MRISRALDAPARDAGDFPEAPGTGAAWWCVEGNPDLGYCAASVKDGILHLDRAWVPTRLRGRGLQRRMIAVREAWGRRQGATIARTYTWGGNVGSMNSLIRAGYTIERRTWDGEKSWIHWRKDLTRVRG